MLNATRTDRCFLLAYAVSFALQPWAAYLQHPKRPDALIHAGGLSLVFGLIAVTGEIGGT